MAVANPILAELSGSIGDVTWSHNRGGAYARRRAVPVNPSSAAQTAVRSALQTVSSRWSTALTSADRAAWSNWAASQTILNPLGLPISLTGQQAFVMLSSRLQLLGLTIPDTPPLSMAPPALVSVAGTAIYAASDLSLAFSAAPGSGKSLDVWWTNWGPQGRLPNINQARRLFTSAAAPTSPLTVPLPSEVPQALATVLYVRVLDRSNGQCSAFLSALVLSEPAP